MNPLSPAIHYLVRFSYFDYKSPDRIDFKSLEKKFRNEDPIKARREAFRWYDNYSNINLLREGLSGNDAEKLTGKDLQDYFNGLKVNQTQSIDNPISVWMAENPRLAHKTTNYSHPELILVIDDETLLDEEKRHHQIFINNKELAIYRIVNLDDPYDVSDYMLCLDQEYAIYKHFNYNTENIEQVVSFFDPEIYDNGSESEKVFENHTILATPFDWQGYDAPLWWMNEDEVKVVIDELTQQEEADKIGKTPFKVLESSTSHEEIIARGEGHSIEFKPCLFAQVEKRNIEREIFNVICSFLNSSGGFIYLGVNDHGVPIGVLENIDKDNYRRKFTDLKKIYFKNGITASNVIGDFIKINDKDIFCIIVEPSKFEPVFLVKTEVRYNNTVNQTNYFYLRQEASTHEIRDPKILIEYVKNHWFSKQ